MTAGSRIQDLRTFLTVGGFRCRHPIFWIIVLAIFSAAAFGAAPFYLARWVSALTSAPADRTWIYFFSLYLLAYALAFGSRDVQWWLYARMESAVLSSVTLRLTGHLVHGRTVANGVGILTQTLQGAQSLLFCSFFILLPAALETVSMLIAILSTTPPWMALPLLLHTAGFLCLIDFGTRRVARHQRRINPYVARVLDLVSAVLGEHSLLQRYATCPLLEQILCAPIQNREAERLHMGWTRTWTTTLLNGWTLCGLLANLALALRFYTQHQLTLGEVVAVESVFFLVLRRLEMWSRGYRETGQAVAQCQDGIGLLTTPHTTAHLPAACDDVRSQQWNVLYGKTGIGKSTWLLQRWQRSAGRAGFLPQRPEILPGSIALNITLGNDTTSAELLPNLLRDFDLERVIHRLPQGLATELWPGRSSPLSGGELQRLCLVRVLLHWQSDELLLDEPTSAQSPGEAAQIFQSLKTYTRGKTVWLVSHHPEALCWAEHRWECTGWNCIEEKAP